MVMLSPSPKNRLYTDFNSYFQYLAYRLGQKSAQHDNSIQVFEAALRERFKTQHAICVYQCRVGIYLAIKALIKPGQDVILSPYTLTDVINMVIFAGGRPVFADVDRETCNISAAEVERLIHPNTGAVLITHLHAIAADAHRIKAVCDQFNVPMVEDCAQSFGVQEGGKPVGTVGDIGVFSFEMHKNIPTWLGGAVVTSRSDVAETIQKELETFTHPPLPGITAKVKKGLMHDIACTPVFFQLLVYPIIRLGHLHEFEFINQLTRRKPQVSEPAVELPGVYRSQYTPFQARIGLSQLKKVDHDIAVRCQYAALYYDRLKDIQELILPPLRTDGSNTYLWFPIQYSKRDDLLRFMYQQGRDIAAGHFTSAINLPEFQDYYRDCPHSLKVEQELIYLPTYPSYSRQEVEKNIQVIQEFFRLHATASVESRNTEAAAVKSLAMTSSIDTQG
jgi:dTDP-4-amino-4,6-dideoxygalactose transaminase